MIGAQITNKEGDTFKEHLKNKYHKDKRIAFESSEYKSSDLNMETSEGEYDEHEPSTSRDVMPPTNCGSQRQKFRYAGTTTGKVCTTSTTKKPVKEPKKTALSLQEHIPLAGETTTINS